MTQRLSSKRGSANALEYALLVIVIAAALLGMARYLKAGMSGQWRAAGDTFGSGRQFDPGNTVVQ